MTHHRRAFLLACVFSVSTTAAFAETRIPVFVRGAAAKDGWTDPSGERADSAKDLARHISAADRKWIQLAGTEPEARVVIEVVGRRKEFRTLVLDVRVTAGDYTTEMSTSSDVSLGSWRDCALKVAKKIDQWANANRERILAARR